MKKILYLISLLIIVYGLNCFEIYTPPRDNRSDPLGDNSCGNAGVPTVTCSLTFIAGTSVQGDCNVTCAADRGLCWNTSGNPTISDSHTSCGTGPGSFNWVITGLTQNTVYHVRAYATYVAGTAYGIDITFNSGWTIGTDYAGGYVFYNDGNGHGLVSAKTDQSTSQVWIAGGSTQTTLNGNTFTAIGTGLANTNAIVVQTGHTGSAAQVCLDYNDGTYSDWFLPSKDELNLMRTNLYLNWVGGFNVWSSSESGPSTAIYQNFPSGSQDFNGYKNSTVSVRAVRAF